MKTSVSVITTSLVLAAFVGLFLGTTSIAVPLASAAPAKSPLQTSSHVTIQNTTISGPDPLPGHQGHQAAIILPPRTDGKLWVGTVTWTSSKPYCQASHRCCRNNLNHAIPICACIRPNCFRNRTFCRKRGSIPHVEWSKVYRNI